MRADETSRDQVVYALTAALLAAILAVEYFTPQGYAEWLLYLIPLALTVLQPRSWFPLAVAGVITVLLPAGFLMSAELSAQIGEIGKINRGLGLLAIWVMAFLARHVVIEKSRAQRLGWITEGMAQVVASLPGEQSVEVLGQSLVDALARYAGALVGRAYRLEGDALMPIGAFGLDAAAQDAGRQAQPIGRGQGMAGEVAKSGKPMLVTHLPEGYLQVSSALGASVPTHLLIAPVTAFGKTSGVVELGFMSRERDFTDRIELMRLVVSPSASPSARRSTASARRSCRRRPSSRARRCSRNRRSCASPTRSWRSARACCASRGRGSRTSKPSSSRPTCSSRSRPSAWSGRRGSWCVCRKR